MHYALATLLLLLLSVSVFVRRLAAARIPGYESLDAVLRPLCDQGVWWSATWVVAVSVLLLFAVPLGIGFWFTHPPAGRNVSDTPRFWTRASIVAGVLAFGACSLGWYGCDGTWAGLRTPLVAAKCVLGWKDDGVLASVWSRVLLTVGALTFLGIGALALTLPFAQPNSITGHRVVMTRAFSTALTWSLMLAALAIVETAAQTLLWQRELVSLSVSLSAVGAALVWLTRFVAKRMDEKSTMQLVKKFHGLCWLASLRSPCGWGLRCCSTCSSSGSSAAIKHRRYLARRPPLPFFWPSSLTCVVLFVFAWATGHFRGFLNLSTFQGLYSARLTRAYLGASNYKRCETARSPWRSVAEPAPEDTVMVDELYASPCAPVHYINVCVNQNVDPGAQLVQRDRKGKPLVIATDGFYLDGDPHPFPVSASKGKSELDSPLTVAEWIGVSGASFTTGLGRSTSLGGSLLLGFANVRLGRWWWTVAIGSPDETSMAARSVPRSLQNTGVSDGRDPRALSWNAAAVSVLVGRRTLREHSGI